jgi:opacity protein-like surface antigen
MTRRTRPPYVLALLLIAMFGAQASAQERPVVAGYAEVGTTSLAAARTFDAVSGNHRATTIGGGAHLSQLWRGLFVDVAISVLSKKGERVSVNDDEVVALGAPLTVRLRHVDLAAGWRHAVRRFSLHAGAGVARVRYVESDSSEPVDLVVARTGWLVLAGVDLSITRWIRVGAELRARRVRGILGSAGLSAHFGEDSAGGVSTAMRLSVGH